MSSGTGARKTPSLVWPATLFGIAGFCVLGGFATAFLKLYGVFKGELYWACTVRPGQPDQEWIVPEPPEAPLSLFPLGYVCIFRNPSDGAFLGSAPPTDWTPNIQIGIWLLAALLLIGIAITILIVGRVRRRSSIGASDIPG